MAEIGIAIAGLSVQGLTLLEKAKKCYKDGKEASFRIQHIQANLKSVNSMLAELKSILPPLSFSSSPGTTSRLRQDLSNFEHVLAMIGDVFALLEALIDKYDGNGPNAPFLQAGRFTPVKNLKLKQKWQWARDDLNQAEKLGNMLAGHNSNLSFALQIMNKSSLTSLKDKMDIHHDAAETSVKVLREDIRLNQEALREMKIAILRQSSLDDREQAIRHQEWESELKKREQTIKTHEDETRARQEQAIREQEEDVRVKQREQSMRGREEEIARKEKHIEELKETLEQLEVLQVNNTRKSDLEKDPHFKRFLESIKPRWASTTKSTMLSKDGEREDDVKESVSHTHSTLEEKIESELKVERLLNEKRGIEAELSRMPHGKEGRVNGLVTQMEWKLRNNKEVKFAFENEKGRKNSGEVGIKAVVKVVKASLKEALENIHGDPWYYQYYVEDLEEAVEKAEQKLEDALRADKEIDAKPNAETGAKDRDDIILGLMKNDSHMDKRSNSSRVLRPDSNLLWGVLPPRASH